MGLDELTKREAEILAELTRGGRIPSIAKGLFISPHTVRNHLRSIFSKLGVHSQAELIAYVKENPSVLGDHVADRPDREAIERTAQICADGDLRVAGKIAKILESNLNKQGLKEVLHAVLPLDPRSVDEWQARVNLFGREFASDDILAPHIARLQARRAQVNERVALAQQEGWVRTELESEVIAKSLYSMVLGAALQLLRDNSETSREQQLFLIDGFVDSITHDT